MINFADRRLLANPPQIETLAPPPGIILPRIGGCLHGFLAGATLGLVKHASRDPTADIPLGPCRVDRLLQVATSSVAPLYGVGGPVSEAPAESRHPEIPGGG